ncbi:MAG: DNA sulfur modification protein DndB [Eubacterium coprostanoligenes]|nr:DNA sulfur modification protein DndB [Eubacterium coprostanoligenes]
MEFSYRFPAVKGIQANSEYYITMVPLKIVNKIFNDVESSGYIPPEYRAQRKLNESRIPEISKYVLDNRNSYVFSALSASIDGDFEFIENSDVPSTGVLEVDMNSKFLINDGQHRKHALEEAILEDPSLLEETISIVFFEDKGLKRSQQMFTDLNKHAVKTSNSISTLYDSRDPLAVITTEIISEIDFFSRYTDKEKDNLGKNSANLFTLTNLYKANSKIVGTDTNIDKAFLLDYWNTIVSNITEWNELSNREITKKELRENYVVTLNVTMIAFGKLGNLFYNNRTLDYKSMLSGLQSIDWTRTSKNWKNRLVRNDGRINSNEEASTLAYIKIKQLLGIKLSDEDRRREKKAARK